MCFPRHQDPEQQQHRDGWQPRISSPPIHAVRTSSQASRAAGASCRDAAGGCAAGGFVGVQERSGGGQMWGDAPSKRIRMQDGQFRCPHLQQIRFSAYETLFEYTSHTNLSNRNSLVYRMTNNTYLISLLFKFFWCVA